jgi:Asp-tRNA(Asn)/Glu-tRNA(Gln) amidotransferase A subunit family amidase
MACLGLGTQTHASTIRPAGYCGAYALKATHGALPVGGLNPLAPTLDHLGLIGASLEDVWASAMAICARVGGSPPHAGLEGPMEAPPAQRPATLVRLDTLGWGETPASSQAQFEGAVARLAAAGVRILDAGNDPETAALEAALREIGEFANDILAWEAQWPLAAYRAHGAGMVGERIHNLLARAAEMTPARYRLALANREAFRARVAAFAGRVDGFVMLCSSGPAIADHGFTGSRSYALPWTLVGGPSFALPLLTDQGLPLGVQLAGFAEQDAETCAHAAWLREPDRLPDSGGVVWCEPREHLRDSSGACGVIIRHGCQRCDCRYVLRTPQQAFAFGGGDRYQWQNIHCMVVGAGAESPRATLLGCRHAWLR